ncbi:MAG: hypothetical protein K0R53_1076, partial [Burkholderiales bacterium]|nr:hypothetical protein [Burkholderiales bacterium]
MYAAIASMSSTPPVTRLRREPFTKTGLGILVRNSTLSARAFLTTLNLLENVQV